MQVFKQQLKTKSFLLSCKYSERIASEPLGSRNNPCVCVGLCELTFIEIHRKHTEHSALYSDPLIINNVWASYKNSVCVVCERELTQVNYRNSPEIQKQTINLFCLFTSSVKGLLLGTCPCVCVCQVESSRLAFLWSTPSQRRPMILCRLGCTIPSRGLWEGSPFQHASISCQHSSSNPAKRSGREPKTPPKPHSVEPSTV